MALLHRVRHGFNQAGKFLSKHGKTIGSVLATAAAVGATAHKIYQAYKGRPQRFDMSDPANWHQVPHIKWKPGDPIPTPMYSEPIH